MNTNELILKSGKTITRIPTDAIVQVAGLGNYSQFWLRDGRRIVSAYTLKVYEQLLPVHFLRVHKACLVNGHCIVGRVGQHQLLLTDGSRVEISRRKADTFREQYAALTTNSTTK
jgi:two-component system, LytTR family, response regulator